MKPIEAVLLKFPDAKRNGKGHRARCPAHDDHNPSLDIIEGADGRVLMTCRTRSCAREKIVAAVGLKMEDLFPPFATRQEAINFAARNDGGTFAEEWEYKYDNGRSAFWVARIDLRKKGKNGKADKSFRPIRPFDGGFRLGYPEGMRVLFGLPELLANPREQLVFLVEGERKRNALQSLGLPGTTSAGGSGAVEKTDWSPLSGRHVCILPDQDSAGRKYEAAVVRKLLHDVEPPAEVCVLALPGLANAEDVHDFILRRRGEGVADEAIREEILTLAAAAPIIRPGEPRDGGDSIPAPIERERAGMEFPPPIPLSKLQRRPGPKFLWYGYLAPEHTTLFTGLFKAGKTTLASALLVEMEHGGDLAGAVLSARVLVVTEESETIWSDRRDKHKLGDHVHVVIRPFRGRSTWPQWSEFIAYIVKLVRENHYDLVIFDPLTNLWPVMKENDAGEVQSAILPLTAITAEGPALLAIHHPRKSDGGEGIAARGSGALAAWADVLLELRRLTPEDHEDRRRVLTAYSRFDETPAEAVVDYTGKGYVKVGTKSDAKRGDRQEVIEGILAAASAPMDADAIRHSWPPDSPIPRPGIKSVRGDLDAGAKAGKWSVSGLGRKGDPLVYVLHVNAPYLIPARAPSMGNESNPVAALEPESEKPSDAGEVLEL